MHLADLVQQVPPWALWLEMGLGWVGLLAVAERVHQGRTPVPMTALVAACFAFGGCGLLLRMVDPSPAGSVRTVSAAAPAPPAIVDP